MRLEMVPPQCPPTSIYQDSLSDIVIDQSDCYGSSAEVLYSRETLGHTKLMVKVSQHRYHDYSIFVGAALGY